MLPGSYRTKRVLIVVRTYPVPAKTGIEVSCTAAITTEGEWMRLFPVPYRFLSDDKRFRKYQWVDVEVKKASDARPESYNIKGDSIRIVSAEPLSTSGGWKARKEWVLPMRSPSLCSLQRACNENNFPTLGIFKPKRIEKLLVVPDSPDWDQGQREILGQRDLFAQGPDVELQKVPFIFKYRFTCDEHGCAGHELSCTDWEMGESWRTWSEKYGDRWESKFRQKYEDEMIHGKDTYFYVGTVHQHPKSWIIVGLFYPPPSAQFGFY